MQTTSSSAQPLPTTSLFPIRGTTRTLILLALFLLSLGVRVYDSYREPYYRFDVRQSYSAVIAKGYYYQLIDVEPERRAAALLNLERQPQNEPHIMEVLAALVWRVTGGDRLWVAGTISTIFWLIGGFFIYRIASLLEGGDGPIFATAVFLFVPQGIYQGNNFQPDPMMVAGIIATTYAILLYGRQQTLRNLLIAAVIAGITIFAKLQSAFIIAMIFLSICIYARGWRRALLHRDAVIFAVVSLLPIAAYLFYGFFISKAFQENAAGRIVPSLWFQARYWRGWLVQINNSVGFEAFIVALLGVAASASLRRYVLAGMWGGYALLGLVFTWNIHTHLYYHLPLVPIIALSVAQIGGAMLGYVSGQVSNRLIRVAVYGILALGVCLSILVVLAEAEPEDGEANYEVLVQDAIEIGELLDHNTNTFYLSQTWGLPLIYHGDLSGTEWARTEDNEVLSVVDGELIPTDPEGVAQLITNNPKLPNPEYFIITDLEQWELQPNLQEYLNDNYPVFAETDRYLIFDLRNPL